MESECEFSQEMGHSLIKAHLHQLGPPVFQSLNAGEGQQGSGRRIKQGKALWQMPSFKVKTRGEILMLTMVATFCYYKSFFSTSQNKGVSKSYSSHI